MAKSYQTQQLRKNIYIKLDDFRNKGKKKNLRRHFRRLPNELSEFDLYSDILPIVYMYSKKRTQCLSWRITHTNSCGTLTYKRIT